MPVPFFSPRMQDAPLLEEIKSAMGRVLDSGQYVGGPEVERFEQECAAFLGARHAVGVSSGTDALLAALMDLGVGPGDRVLTSPFSFFATAGVIHRVGAEPVFCDIDPETFCLTAAAVRRFLEEDAARRERVKAIIPVHLYGYALEPAGFRELAEEFRLTLVEDAAQAIGARAGGAAAGTWGEYGCLSFYPTKNLGAFGDAGMVLCQDAERAQRLRLLRNHGMEKTYEHQVVGGNFRLDALQAAALRVKLGRVAGWNRARQELAEGYRRRLLDRGLGDRVRTGSSGAPGQHVFHQFVVRVKDREPLREHLSREGIGTAVYYPIPLHRQPCFRNLAFAGRSLPEAERAAREVLALPMHAGLRERDLDEVVDAVARFYRL